MPGGSVSGITAVLVRRRRRFAVASRSEQERNQSERHQRQARACGDGTRGRHGRQRARRSILGGLAVLPVLATVASAAPALASSAARPASVPTAAAGDLARGQERRYNAPLLTAGTRLLLPAGVKAVPVVDYYHRPRLGRAASAWPHLRAADGSTVDASVVPDRGAPTRVAILSGFTEGWYQLAHASGRADRVTWDARKLPYLFVHGEFGGTDEEPFRGRFYTLALQPMSRNPYLRSTTIL
jgi:hypothetical protein